MKKNFKIAFLVILFTIYSTTSAQNKYPDNIVNSIDDILTTLSPTFKYTNVALTDDNKIFTVLQIFPVGNNTEVKTDSVNIEGKQYKRVKYIDYLKSLIKNAKNKGNDIYLAKALSCFSSITGELSKIYLKKYAKKYGNADEIRQAYLLFSYLPNYEIDNNKMITLSYFLTIKSIEFFFQVSENPFFKELEKKNKVLEDIKEVDYETNLLILDIAFIKNLQYYIISCTDGENYKELDKLHKESNHFLNNMHKYESSKLREKTSQLISGYLQVINKIFQEGE